VHGDTAGAAAVAAAVRRALKEPGIETGPLLQR
jgi:lactam utilization protein B